MVDRGPVCFIRWFRLCLRCGIIPRSRYADIGGHNLKIRIIFLVMRLTAAREWVGRRVVAVRSPSPTLTLRPSFVGRSWIRTI